jgi:hypothetical protein
MSEPIKIELPLFDLKYNKNLKRIQHHFILEEDMLVFVLECYMDVHPKPEDDLPVIKYEQYLNQIDRIRRKDIYYVCTKYNNDMETWSLEWWFGNEDLYCNFETEAQLREVEKVFLDWWRKVL